MLIGHLLGESSGRPTRSAHDRPGRPAGAFSLDEPRAQDRSPPRLSILFTVLRSSLSHHEFWRLTGPQRRGVVTTQLNGNPGGDARLDALALDRLLTQ